MNVSHHPPPTSPWPQAFEALRQRLLPSSVRASFAAITVTAVRVCERAPWMSWGGTWEPYPSARDAAEGPPARGDVRTPSRRRSRERVGFHGRENPRARARLVGTAPELGFRFGGRRPRRERRLGARPVWGHGVLGSRRAAGTDATALRREFQRPAVFHGREKSPPLAGPVPTPWRGGFVPKLVRHGPEAARGPW